MPTNAPRPASLWSQYQRKNMRHVYDALATLAAGVEGALAEPRVVALFVPPLLAKWEVRRRWPNRPPPLR